MFKGSYHFRISMLFYLCLIMACTAKKAVEAAPEIKSGPQLLFLNYTIAKNDNGPNIVTQVDQIIVDGKLKKGNEHNDSAKTGDLRCLQVDAQLKELNVHLIPNPLYKRVEYVDDNELLASKMISLDEAEFSLRLQLEPLTEFIIIEEVMPKEVSANKTLLKSKITHQ